jgi:hypothetical protein
MEATAARSCEQKMADEHDNNAVAAVETAMNSPSHAGRCIVPRTAACVWKLLLLRSWKWQVEL